MLYRFILYGIFGCFGELLWTSTSAPVLSLARRSSVDLRLPAQTYLWMFPIYGVGGLVFEQLHAVITGWPWLVRGVIYTVFIFVGEYVWGWGIQRVTGKVPWDYTGARFSVHGRIRLDYAPLWFVVGITTEWIQRVITAAARGIAAGL